MTASCGGRRRPGSPSSGVLNTAHAGLPTPQIAGSVAAPTAAEASPICDAPDPSAILGPSIHPAANPTSTVVTPSGGVANFAATSSDLYVDTGSQLDHLHAVRQPGRLVRPSVGISTGRATRSPIRWSTRRATSTWPATTRSKLTKFSPTGQVLWSVDPEGGNPTGIFSVGTGSGFQLMVSVVQNKSASGIVNQSTGAVSGSFPLFDDFDYVTQESDGNLLYSGNGYVETFSPTGSVLSSFGSTHTEGAGAHTGSGTQFYYPGPGRPGTRRDHLHGRPARHHRGHQPQRLLRGLHHPRPDASAPSSTWAATTSTWSAPPSTTKAARPFNNGADNISSISLATLHHLPRRRPCADRHPRVGSRTVDAGAGQLLRPGTDPDGRRHLRPVVAVPGLPPPAVLLGGEHRLAERRDRARPRPPSPSPPPRPGWPPSRSPSRRPTSCPAPTGSRPPLTDTCTSPPTALGTTCMPYTVGADRRRPQPRHPAERHRLGRTRRPPGRGPQRPTRASTGLRGRSRSTGAPSCPTARRRPRPRRPAAPRP